MEIQRKLVTLRKISEIRPIPDADAIECAVIEGWTVVTKKNEFKVGDWCVYFEIDSFLPVGDDRFAFLFKNKTVFGDTEGVRLKTVRLRKQLSQGLALPVASFMEILLDAAAVCKLRWTVEPQTDNITAQQMEDAILQATFAAYDENAEAVRALDFTELLKVKKWEPSLPACLSGKVRGNFPHFIPKTDQERIQNISKTVFDDLDAEYEVTIKLDGSSTTMYKNVVGADRDFGVCSRNLNLDLSDEGNSFVRAAKELGFPEGLDIAKMQGVNYALQGELMGPGIQGNREGLKTTTFFVFDVYNISEQRHMTADERQRLINDLKYVGFNVQHVPVLHARIKLRDIATNLDELLAYAEGPSLTHAVREGLVFKRVDGLFSFKVISNKFLLAEK